MLRYLVGDPVVASVGYRWPFLLFLLAVGVGDCVGDSVGDSCCRVCLRFLLAILLAVLVGDFVGDSCWRFLLATLLAILGIPPRPKRSDVREQDAQLAF